MSDTAFPTVIACPRCGQRQSTITAEALFKATTRCVAPACNVRFSIQTRKDAVGDGYRVLVGFTPADKEANRLTEAGERTELDKLPLAELIKRASEIEDFYTSLSGFYEEKLERLLAYTRARRRAIEAASAENAAEREVRKRTAAAKAPPPPEKEKGKRAVAPAVVNISAYRTQLLSIIDTFVSVGKYTPAEGTNMRTEACATEDGLWRVASKVGLPTFQR